MYDLSVRLELASIALSVLVLCIPATASEPDNTADKPAQTAEGILPLPAYGGNIWTRSHLLGDFDGARSDLAEQGVQFDIEWTQTVQGVVDGGLDETTRYGGSLDYNLKLDLQRMGVMQGGLVTIRAESRYGNSVNVASGSFLSVNTDAFFPLTSTVDDDIAFTITSLNYTQFFSPQFGVFVGKIDMLDGDLNEFASGRGVTQFQNSALITNPVGAISLPYSTLAGGLVWKPTAEVSVSSVLLNSVDSSTTTGFGDFGDGWIWLTGLQFQYRLGDLPGGQSVSVLYEGDSEFRLIGSLFVPQPGIDTDVTEDSTWHVSWNGWQYLWTEEAPDAPIDLLNRVPDLQGFGLFARAGVADQDTNPIDWSINIGVGGRGIIPGRDDDVFGIGYYYNNINAERLPGGINDYGHGLEAFYNIALTPSSFLTLDAQVVEGPFQGTDTAVILGARLHLRF